MAILQFTPLSSFPSPSFWQQLTSLKLDTHKLDDSVRDILGWLEEGRSALNREAGSQVWMRGHLAVNADSFANRVEDTLQPNIIALHGKFRNFNTIEEFRSPELKKQLFSEVVKRLVDSFSSNDPSQITTFNPFLLVSFADLKKYVYHYWFAFPALVQKPAWEIVAAEEEESSITETSMRDWEGSTDNLRHMKAEAQISAEAFLYRPPQDNQSQDSGSVAPVTDWWSFFQGVPEEERTLIFHDPTSSPSLPGWTLRNVLYYLSHHLAPPKESPRERVTTLKVIALRGSASSATGSIGTSKVFSVKLPPVVGSGMTTPAVAKGTEDGPLAVGWERNPQGKLASRVADLGSTMDPKQLADQAVDLNLKLMRWRIMPALDLEKIAGTRCLLLGAGTLGCYVARSLLGWGVRNITFVDSAKVSFSNPARQPLFEFEDSLNGGKPKAAAAAEAMKRIFPNVNATGIALSIPMPGHPVSPTFQDLTKDIVEQLHTLIKNHDTVFLLMDSRESRWLPTLIATMENKIVINAALGFDSWLVMRHGASGESVAGSSQAMGEEKQRKRLGCYFCNDIVAPTDSLTDRTLDQMCTVTRPGIAPIAAASAVELMIVDAYREMGFGMLLRVFNESDYLQTITGLDELYEEGEAALEAVDWEEEGSDEGL
ncbi:hypothetical protein QFC19_006171 [Naganishia cerealis]|uniref:Uncharacterized protein n=1 Tax=Naganishia cerealis TaxID=610337 RepID=A0ACC2VI33_9TREE|nr:hypothetical protein QFC19_006171 [Naganishia cerealis]